MRYKYHLTIIAAHPTFVRVVNIFNNHKLFVWAKSSLRKIIFCKLSGDGGVVESFNGLPRVEFTLNAKIAFSTIVVVVDFLHTFHNCPHLKIWIRCGVEWAAPNIRYRNWINDGINICKWVFSDALSSLARCCDGRVRTFHAKLDFHTNISHPNMLHTVFGASSICLHKIVCALAALGWMWFSARTREQIRFEFRQKVSSSDGKFSAFIQLSRSQFNVLNVDVN